MELQSITLIYECKCFWDIDKSSEWHSLFLTVTVPIPGEEKKLS